LHPQLVGELLHWGLFGTLSIQLCEPSTSRSSTCTQSVQTFIIWRSQKDKLRTKCLVYGVYAIELVETILITHDAFTTFGYGFGDISTFTKVGFDWLTIPVMSGLGNFDVESLAWH
jgi:hypothetical protein